MIVMILGNSFYEVRRPCLLNYLIWSDQMSQRSRVFVVLWGGGARRGEGGPRRGGGGARGGEGMQEEEGEEEEERTLSFSAGV